jgi:metallo-beta-lactamase family protein
MFGDEVKVEARIRRIGNYSAHADQKELVDWVVERLPVRGGIFLTHGEDQAREALRAHLVEAGCEPPIHLPKLDDSFELLAAAAAEPEPRAPRIPDSEIARDWHNDYAILLLDLSRRLERLPDDAARRELLRRLRAELPG